MGTSRTLLFEAFLLTTAVIDLILAALMTRTLLGLVPTLTRVVIPIAVWRLLRRGEVRVEFAAPSDHMTVGSRA